MAISEEKMRIVINNYFKSERNIDTSIRQAFEKGFRIGVEKGLAARPEITLESAIDYLDSIGWMQEHDRILTESAQPERKTGNWIPHKSIFGGLGEKVYTCDQCGYNIGFHTENFCPNCGADMREDGKQDGRIN